MAEQNANQGMLQLYICFQERIQGWMNLHRQHFTQFITIILAVFTISLGASYQFKDEGWFIMIASLGPLFNVLLSSIATEVCDRFYRRSLEALTIADKLCYIINKNYKIDNQVKASKELFPNDSYLFPERWRDNWKKDDGLYSTADEFVEEYMGRGSNKLIRRTFLLLNRVNLVIGAALAGVGSYNIKANIYLSIAVFLLIIIGFLILKKYDYLK